MNKKVDFWNWFYSRIILDAYYSAAESCWNITYFSMIFGIKKLYNFCFWFTNTNLKLYFSKNMIIIRIINYVYIYRGVLWNSIYEGMLWSAALRARTHTHTWMHIYVYTAYHMFWSKNNILSWGRYWRAFVF